MSNSCGHIPEVDPRPLPSKIKKVKPPKPVRQPPPKREPAMKNRMTTIVNNTTHVTVNGSCGGGYAGGGGGGGDGGSAAGLIVLATLGVLIALPAITAFIVSLISLVVTLVMCTCGVALTGGALYFLREYMRERRIRLEQDLLIAQHQMGMRPLHQISDARYIGPVIDATPTEGEIRAVGRLLGIHATPRRELER